MLILLLLIPLIFSQNFPKESWNILKEDEVTKRGWNIDRLNNIKFHAGFRASQSMVVIHQGDVVFEFGNITKKFISKSIRKGLVWSLFGELIQNEKLKLTDNLEKLGVNDEPELMDKEKRATLDQIFKSTSAVYHDAIYEYGFPPKPPRNSIEPGTYFWYNNWGHNAVATIYEKFTNNSIFQDFLRKIAIPIQMQDYKGIIGPNHIETEEKPYSPYDPKYDGFFIQGKKSIHPAYQFLLSPRDLARFGVLILNYGMWNGVQIIPRSWVEKVLSYDHTIFNYFFWDHRWMKEVIHPPKGIISLLGTGDCGLVMIPYLDIVVVHMTEKPLSAYNSSESAHFSNNMACLVSMALESYYPLKRNSNNRDCPIGIQEEFAIYSFWISVVSSSTVVFLIFSASTFVICTSLIRTFKSKSQVEDTKNYEVLQ